MRARAHSFVEKTGFSGYRHGLLNLAPDGRGKAIESAGSVPIVGTGALGLHDRWADLRFRLINVTESFGD
jgi:hypothetical protein